MELRYTEDEVQAASTVYFGGDRLAARVFTTKYALSHIVDGGKVFAELTPDDMHRRLAREFARIEAQYPSPASEDELYESMRNFRYIVPQGSPMFGVGNHFVNVSLSNCVVVASPEDSWNGIQRSATELGNLYKRRAGVGIDLSTLRPAGARVNNAALTTTGAYSFAEHFSNITKLIGQNGRRGALMVTLDVRHPDIELFAEIKRDRKKVTAANMSVMLTEDFMLAVENDEEWVTRWPVDAPVETAQVTRTYRARDLWRTINESAWMCAEPGLIFADNYRSNLPAHYYKGFEFLTVNPCSEIGLSPYDSCRLVSINLKNFVKDPYTDRATFDFPKFREIVRLAMRVADDIVDLEIECLTNIIESSDEIEDKELWRKLRQSAIDGRRTGLGTHGLADALSGLGIRYDSDVAIPMVQTIYGELRDRAYDQSVELGIQRGVFPAQLTGNNRDLDECPYIHRMPSWLQEKLRKHGRRNISLLTMAPTGSVSQVSQTSSGIEPPFDFGHTRRKKIEAHETARVDFTDEQGDKWEHFEVFHHAAKEYLQLLHPGEAVNLSMLGELPDYFVAAPTVEPMRRVRIQGEIQQYIDHGISSTINLDKDVPVELIEAIYMEAWKAGLKGQTVYREGSRDGVLIHEGATGSITEARAPKRPKELKCAIHRVKIRARGEDEQNDWLFFVSLLDGQPFEIFGGPSDRVDLPRKVVAGAIVKRRAPKGTAKKTGRTNCYDLLVGEGDDQIVVRDIATIFSPKDEDYGVLTRIVSQELRHGIPVQHIVDQLAKNPEAALNTFTKVLARVLKKYVKDGARSGENCPDCGAKFLFQEGCQTCPDCGHSKCQ